MACNFINVNSKAACKESFSGVGATLYLFQFKEGKTPTAASFYKEDKAQCVLNLEDMLIHEVKVKAKTGKVDSTLNPDGGGFTNTYEGRVANNMDDMSLLLRAMNNSNDWGALVGAGNDEYYVLYDPSFPIELSGTSTTGDAPDSDHGHTITIACGPMKYPLCKVALEGVADAVCDDAAHVSGSGKHVGL